VGVEKGLLGRDLGKMYLGCYEPKSSNAFLSKGESWSTVVFDTGSVAELAVSIFCSLVGRLETPKPINPGPQGERAV